MPGRRQQEPGKVCFGTKGTCHRVRFLEISASSWRLWANDFKIFMMHSKKIKLTKSMMQKVLAPRPDPLQTLGDFHIRAVRSGFAIPDLQIRN